MALDDVSLAVPHGALAALVGPDGAGKTTLIRLIAGLMPLDAGALTVMGIDVASEPQRVQDCIAYMPQRFGLYEDLSVREIWTSTPVYTASPMKSGARRYPELLQMTDLAAFTGRLAGNLSGGMKQKLGLACTLIGSPELLLLDEPTVGVDPLSRRELWEIIARLVREQNLSVLMSTSYLDEAERCDHVFVLREGKLLADGWPGAVTNLAAGRSFEAEPGIRANRHGTCKRNSSTTPQSSTRSPKRDACISSAPPLTSNRSPAKAAQAWAALKIVPVQARFEDGFMVLLHERAGQVGAAGRSAPKQEEPAVSGAAGDTVIEVRDLDRSFGDSSPSTK